MSFILKCDNIYNVFIDLCIFWNIICIFNVLPLWCFLCICETYITIILECIFLLIILVTIILQWATSGFFIFPLLLLLSIIAGGSLKWIIKQDISLTRTGFDFLDYESFVDIGKGTLVITLSYPILFKHFNYWLWESLPVLFFFFPLTSYSVLEMENLQLIILLC